MDRESGTAPCSVDSAGGWFRPFVRPSYSSAPSKPMSPTSSNKLGLNSRIQLSHWIAAITEPG
jgi:hypothetical protein